MKISDYIIMSDVDGTLLNREGTMPKRNIEAIKRFVSKGGRFGIATGRAGEVIGSFVKILPVNMPCIIHNGGGIYDYQKDAYLMQTFLPDSATADINTICSDFKDSTVLVVAGENYYMVQNGGPHIDFSEEHMKALRYSKIDKILLPWYKALFLMPESRVDFFNEYIAVKSFDGIRFVYVHPIMAELLPADSSKGSALMELEKLGYLKRECVAAVGDYYNDAEMIEFAAIGAVTAEAPDELKAKAQFVTGPCDGGAVADLVEYLESIAD